MHFELDYFFISQDEVAMLRSLRPSVGIKLLHSFSVLHWPMALVRFIISPPTLFDLASDTLATILAK